MLVVVKSYFLAARDCLVAMLVVVKSYFLATLVIVNRLKTVTCCNARGCQKLLLDCLATLVIVNSDLLQRSWSLVVVKSYFLAMLVIVNSDLLQCIAMCESCQK